MGLVDDLATIRPSRRGDPGGPCAVTRILASLDGDDRAALDVKLRDRRYPATRLAAVLTEHGFPVSHSTISAWRTDHVPR